MPTVNLLKSDIDLKLGELTEEQFNDVCFSFGLELDEVTSEYEMVLREQGAARAAQCSKETIYKVDVPANRYDLLCVEGLTRALSVFQEAVKTPRYVCTASHSVVAVTQTVDTLSVRPFLVAAILRNITMTEANYKSFISLQDKLHQNIGRRRTVVSIGTHDLDTLQPPFIYDCRKPQDIVFVPLGESREFSGSELMEHYSTTNSHLKPYLHIIRDCELYPVICDSRGTVLSLPPIINGEHSKIKLTTRNIFIEITATDLHKASVTLDTVVAMFSEYCDKPYEVEPVSVVRPDGSGSHLWPELQYREETVSVDYINRLVNSKLQAEEMARLLSKMGLGASVRGSTAVLTVEVPPTRHDILHRCDIVEDVAIAIGYDNIEQPHETVTVNYHQQKHLLEGSIRPINKLTDDIRLEMVKNQYTEILSFTLCSKEDISSKLCLDVTESEQAVQISNPKTVEFQVARTTLLPGLLQTITNNQNMPLPLRLFEVQDVVLLQRKLSSDVGAVNERRLCAVNYGNEPDFEELLDTLHGVMTALSVPYRGLQHSNNAECGGVGDTKVSVPPTQSNWYCLENCESNATLMKGRSFIIKTNDGGVIGSMGIIRPKVLRNFGIRKHWASVMEINIESLL